MSPGTWMCSQPNLGGWWDGHSSFFCRNLYGWVCS